MEEDPHEFPDQHESPEPGRLLGASRVPREPHELHHHRDPPDVVDEVVDVFGAEDVTARLAERLRAVAGGSAHLAADDRRVLEPPFLPHRDHVDGPPSAQATLVVFGAFGTPASHGLGTALDALRARHPTAVRIAWRHFPDPDAHPRAGVLALVAEAGASLRGFWPIGRELLRLRHHDPRDVHDAMLRAGLDPQRTIDAMRAGTGIDRIVDDVTSARASGVTFSPALFVNGEQYEGELEAGALSAALLGD